jgi:hypothetical protein
MVWLVKRRRAGPAGAKIQDLLWAIRRNTGCALLHKPGFGAAIGSDMLVVDVMIVGFCEGKRNPYEGCSINFVSDAVESWDVAEFQMGE